MRIASVLAFGLALAGTEAYAAEKITLWHSYNGAEREALHAALAAFAETNPGFEIDVSAVPYDALADKLTAAIPRGHGPDVFIFAHDRVGGWAEGGQIQPIELFVDEAMLDEHETACVFALAYGPSLYGLPLAHKALALYVRTDRVPEPPKSYDELMTIAKANTDPKKGRYGFTYNNIDFFVHTPLMFSLGGKIFEGRDPRKGISGTPNVKLEANVKSLELAKRIKDAGVVPDDPNQVAASAMFSDGRTPMVVSGPWFKSEIDEKVPYTVVPLPAFEGGERSSGLSTCEAVMMSAQTKHPKEAFAFMHFLANDLRSAEPRMKVAGQPVTLHSAWEKVLPQLDEAAQTNLRSFKSAFEASIPAPSDPAMAAVWTPMNAALYKVIHLNKSPAKSIDSAQQRIERALAQGQ